MDRARRRFLRSLSSLWMVGQMPPGRKGPLAWIGVVSSSGPMLTVSTEGTTARQGAKLSRWTMTWGDGAIESGPGRPPVTLDHWYGAEGAYRVTLTVWDTRGLSHEGSVTGVILYAKPTSTVAGTLALTSTFKSISVRRDFVGLQTVTLQYKPSASSTWLSADTPIYDGRSTVGGQANPYQFQYRASIVGLSAGTSYDVRMTIGGTVYQSSVSTLSSSITNGGTTRTVTPANIAAALAVAVPGDVIDMTDGTYAAFSFATSGTENAWISFVGRNRDACFIDGGAPDLTIDANYLQFKNIRFKKPTATGTNQGNCVTIASSRHHIWLENIYTEDLQLPTGGASYGNAAIEVGNDAHHVYVLNSTLLCPSLASKSDGDFDTGGFGIQGGRLGAEGALVIDGCTITGKFQDPIGSAESVGELQWGNSDILNSTITGFVDDGLQLEGDAINCRVIGNVITDTNGNSCIAQAAGYVGPTYIARNLLIKTGGVASQVFKFYENQYPRLYHNTIDNQVTSCDVMAAGAINTEYGIDCRNNIFRTSAANVLFNCAPGGANELANRWDYNLYYRADAGNIVGSWNGNGALNYATVVAFFIAQSQEEHGLSGSDPDLQGATRTITSSSPAYRAGVAIPNFNDADSAWPASLAGSPCLGYFEAA